MLKTFYCQQFYRPVIICILITIIREISFKQRHDVKSHVKFVWSRMAPVCHPISIGLNKDNLKEIVCRLSLNPTVTRQQGENVSYVGSCTSSLSYYLVHPQMKKE